MNDSMLPKGKPSEMIKKVCFSLMVCAGIYAYYLRSVELTREKKMSQKHLDMVGLLCRWLECRQRNMSLRSYFSSRGYYNIAIYGMSYIGKSLAKELDGSEINVCYGVDRNALDVTADFEIISPDEEFASVDVVVVTSSSSYEEIRKIIASKLSCPIISIDEIVNEIRMLKE